MPGSMTQRPIKDRWLEPDRPIGAGDQGTMVMTPLVMSVFRKELMRPRVI